MLLTRKTDSARVAGPRLSRAMGARIATMDRRAFLKRSGLVAGAGAFASQLPYGTIGKAEAADDGERRRREVKRTVCTHCSVGCAIDAVVENGVWMRQEPVFDSPLNLGAHCAKGASIREHGITSDSHRLKYADEARQRQVPEDQLGAGDQRGRRQAARDPQGIGPRRGVLGRQLEAQQRAVVPAAQVRVVSSARNNCDHQARICHSTTVSGVANTWGYGAMTNSYNDMQNTKCALYIGSNAAEAHPVSMLHMLHAKETGAKMIVVDPRFTRTAAKADDYVRIRSGTDIAFLFGMLYHIFKNGWEDKQVHPRPRLRHGQGQGRRDGEVDAGQGRGSDCGVPEAQVYKVAEMMAKNRPSTLVWCMGQTQHTIGNAIVRASCIVQLALGNIGVSGGGANIFRGHDNVQGATDIGPNPDSLPGYYGVADRLVEALRRGVGRRLRVDQEAVRVAGDDGKARHDGVALDRRRAREERADRPGQQPARAGLLGPRAEQPDARQGNGRGDEEARPAGRHRSVSVGDRGDGGDGAQGRRLPAAGVHAARDVRVASPRRTARCSGASA